MKKDSDFLSCVGMTTVFWLIVLLGPVLLTLLDLLLPMRDGISELNSIVCFCIGAWFLESHHKGEHPVLAIANYALFLLIFILGIKSWFSNGVLRGISSIACVVGSVYFIWKNVPALKRKGDSDGKEQAERALSNTQSSFSTLAKATVSRVNHTPSQIKINIGASPIRAMDTIALAAFLARLNVLRNCKSQSQADKFTQLYFSELYKQIAKKYGVSQEIVARFMDNRLATYERAYMSSDNEPPLSNLAFVHAQLLLFDAKATVFSFEMYSEISPLVVADIFTMSDLESASLVFMKETMGAMSKDVDEAKKYLQ